MTPEQQHAVMIHISEAMRRNPGITATELVMALPRWTCAGHLPDEVMKHAIRCKRITSLLHRTT